MPSDEPRNTALWVAAREGTAALACPLDRPHAQEQGQEGSSNGSGDISSSGSTAMEAVEAAGSNGGAGGVGAGAVTMDLGQGPGATPPPPATGTAEPFVVGAAVESTMSMQSVDLDELLGGQGVGMAGLGPGEGQGLEGVVGLGQEGRRGDEE